MRNTVVSRPLMALCVWCLTSACAPTLETPNDGSDGGSDILCPTADPICNAELGDGVMLTHIAAIDQRAWVYFDFQTMTVTNPEVPEQSQDWDLAFRRFVIKTNGGVSGMGDVQFTFVDPEVINFSSLTLPPVNGEWLTDAPDDDDPDEDPEYLMATGDSGWFDYNPANHVLTPRERIYIVRSVEGQHFKLEIQAYYDEVGSPAHLRFRWAAMAN